MSYLRRNPHLSDAVLLLLLEGDLEGRARRHSEEHLSRCSACRSRRSALMEANDGVQQYAPGVSARSDVTESSRPAVDTGSAHASRDTAEAARNRLALGLAQEAQATQQDWRTRLRQRPARHASLLLRAATVGALLGCALLWRQFGMPMQDRMAAYEDTGPEPSHALTPGSVDPVALAELCGLSDSELDPRVSPEKERAVFHAYGMDERAARAYQVDYLINPQLGGNDRLENLWPEPYHATVWNARAKDALETRLHGLVCSGQLDLQAAQQDLSTDWIAAYKKYFHTQRPVSTVAELDRQNTGAARLP